MSKPSNFGNPDGARADLDESLLSGTGQTNLDRTLEHDDLGIRCVVGKKGAGKTLYLRRIQDYAASQTEIYSDDVQHDAPSTEEIVRFCHWYPTEYLLSKWGSVWRVAILSSLTSHLCQKAALRKNAQEYVFRLENDFTKLLRKFLSPVSIYGQVREMLHRFNSVHAMDRYLNNPLWNDLEYALGDILKQCPPVYFFLDSLDEEFSTAPMYWLHCQEGLFNQVMRFLRDARLGGRLHVIISLRDIVYASICSTEHATRYREEPHIRILHWNKTAISQFLKLKLDSLPYECFLGDAKHLGKSVQAWLGTSSIRNHVRSVEESIEDYLLRHTRLLPRDVIILGNALCNAVLNQKQHPVGDFTQTIQKIVAETAHILGEEQLVICANQIISHMMPQHAVNSGYASKEFALSVVDQLKDIIREVGKDRFTSQLLKIAEKRAEIYWGSDVDLSSILWQNGLLGYGGRRIYDSKPDTVTFFSDDMSHEFVLPRGKSHYAFHPCLIDCVGIRAIGMPVMTA